MSPNRGLVFRYGYTEIDCHTFWVVVIVALLVDVIVVVDGGTRHEQAALMTGDGKGFKAGGT